jgi:hypothetical protein
MPTDDEDGLTHKDCLITGGRFHEDKEKDMSALHDEADIVEIIPARSYEFYSAGAPGATP